MDMDELEEGGGGCVAVEVEDAPSDREMKLAVLRAILLPREVRL